MARYSKNIQEHTGEVSDDARQLALDLGINTQWANNLLAGRRHYFPLKAMPLPAVPWRKYESTALEDMIASVMLSDRRIYSVIVTVVKRPSRFLWWHIDGVVHVAVPGYLRVIPQPTYRH